VLSGAGANLVLALLGKTQPTDVAALVASLLDDGVPDEFHPFLALIQTFFEPADPGNYARRFVREPPPGTAARSTFQSIGLVDHYTPVASNYALAVALGLQPAAPILEPVAGAALAGLDPVTAPLRGNASGGAATAVALEYLASAGSDGHFVIFQERAAIRQYTRFLATLARDGVATLVP
jgi:hypothetical protein